MCGICNRKDCYAYYEEKMNNCWALSEVYKDSSKCPFYKSNKVLNKDQIIEEIIAHASK